LNTLNKRSYKLKSPKLKFICPLCTSNREMKYQKCLSALNYVQIVLLTLVTTYFAFSAIGAKAILSFFMYWMVFEMVNKFLYRRELPCPHCGFDATWYKRDVKIAKKKVEEFWEKQAVTKPVMTNPSSSSENLSQPSQTTA